MTTPNTPHPKVDHSPPRRWRAVETSRTLDRAVRIASSLIRNGADGGDLAIRVEGLSTVSSATPRPTLRMLAIAAVPAVLASTAAGIVIAVVGGGPVARWALLSAMVGLVTGMALGAVSSTRDRRRRTVPVLGARRFVVARNATDERESRGAAR